ncbi:Diphosphomevalonate decarboxylase [Pediococcus damnosus]|uniref:diphosphomevalonate decarboxylase n=1 Tax=Pediococcus damnosus TaxID=51663 RepID=UPI00078EBDD4|nr:diphosphomevalonate decarboxylase [Pediococcus damnosus]AMV70196.1 Diphosphomevalonate decarboxylase [Pediococcus damnosus]
MVTARAHTNIALLKYWGKKDINLILPYNDSISLTLDHFYTDTSVEFDPSLKTDEILVDQQPSAGSGAKRVKRVLNLIRKLGDSTMFASVHSTNHVPSTAGLASSASAFAALASAGAKAAGLNLSERELSILARHGSGSASRSIFGGFVQWHAGHDDQSSYAQPIQRNVDWDINLITVLVDTSQKKISSTNGMQSVVETSPFYPAWVKSAQADVKPMQTAILNRNLATLGELAEQNAMRMHATTFGAVPSFTYFQPQTLAILTAVRNMRKQGVECYSTADAGPNVKIICASSDNELIMHKLSKIVHQDQLLVCKPGPGITYL